MDVILSRNQALTVPLLSTHGTATLLSRDGEEVKVPLAPLLGASILVRSMVTEAHLHPGIHGPLQKRDKPFLEEVSTHFIVFK